MNPIHRDQLIGQLHWRYATKKFDPSRKIDPKDWEALEEALILTPSSFGLQPWKFIVITNPVVKEKLTSFSWGQKQVADCSHHVVFAIRKNVGEVEIHGLIKRMVEVRGVSHESLTPYRDLMLGALVKGPTREIINEWAIRQVYIALGNFMTCAALMGIDACPMEGIEPAKYDEVLGLEKLGLATCLACAAGYRHTDDKYAQLAKIRHSVEEVLLRV